MAFKNYAATVTLTNKAFPDWAPGSEWEIRSEKGGSDDDAVQAMTYKRVVGEIDRKAVRAALKQGKDVTDLIPITDEQIMSSRAAYLAHMSVGWSGDEFRLPAGHPQLDDSLKPVIDSRTGKPKIDNCAGQVPPCSEHFIRQQDSYVLEDVYEYMTAIWAGRSPEQEADFPESAESLDVSPADDGQGSGGVSEAA